MTPRPRLYTFGISHYCEKARWALDWYAIDYDEVRWPPGPHLLLAGRLGAAETSVPILRDCDLERAREIERRADEGLGVHVRRLAYAKTLTYGWARAL